MILPWRCRIILIFELMVAGRISPLWVGFKWLVLVFICLHLKLLLTPRYGELQKSVVMLVWSVAVLSCRFLGVMQTVQRAEFWGAIVAMQAYWPYHLGIDNLNVARTIGRRSLLSSIWSLLEVGRRFWSLRLKGRMCNMVGFGWRINWGTLRLILPLTWVVVISLKLSLILGVDCSKCVVIGTL